MGNKQACHSDLARISLIWVRRAILLVSVAFAYSIAIGNFGLNSDLFLAFAAGKRVLHEGLAAPCQWSFTNSGALWVDQSWLSHLIYYIFYENLGAIGPVLVKALLLLCCSAFLFFRCKRLTLDTDISIFTLCLGLLAAGPFLTIRAENFGILYLLVLGSLLSDTFWPSRVRTLGIPLTIAFWCNSHGSFMLGVGLVIAKACLVGMRAGMNVLPFCYREPGRSLVMRWILVAAVSIAACAFLNPYGLSNLTMPFVQMGAGIVTSNSSDWLPLLNFSDAEVRIIGAGSQFPYMLFVLWVFLASLFVWAVVRKEMSNHSKHRSEHSDGIKVNDTSTESISAGIGRKLQSLECDLWIEAVLVFIVIALSFKHRRFILFSALALVPAASIVLTLMIDAMATIARKRLGDRLAVKMSKGVSTVAAFLLMVGCSWVFYVTAVLPYSPNNPLRPARPTSRELMSFDTFSDQLASFIRQNKLEGRTLAGWEISSYLLYNTPQLDLFMDTRDQSFFPPKIINDYFTIMGVIRPPNSDPQQLLDEYGVSMIVMTTYPYDFDLGVRMLQSRKWGCIFSDDYSMVLVRRDRPGLSQSIESADYSSLWYPDEETRIRSEAVQSFFGSSRVSPELGRKLKELTLSRPWPNYYRLICWAFDDPRSCLKPETERFLKSEVARLISKDPFYRHGAEEITASLTAIMAILKDNAYLCGRSEEMEKLGIMEKVLQRQYDDLLLKYRGYVEWKSKITSVAPSSP